MVDIYLRGRYVTSLTKETTERCVYRLTSLMGVGFVGYGIAQDDLISVGTGTLAGLVGLVLEAVTDSRQARRETKKE